MNRLSELDERITNKLRMEPGVSSLWKVVAFLAHSGDSWFWAAGLGLVWVFTSGEWHRKSALLAVGVGLAAVVVMAIKYTVRRKRPGGEWGAMYRSVDPHSFPSGHAVRAVLLAVLACEMGPTWLGLLFVIWAPLVSLARVMTGMHYLSDVIAGGVLGLFLGGGVIFLEPGILSLLPFLF